MFEKIRCNNFGGSCIGKTSGYKCAICSTKVKCEQETIKRLEWLKDKLCDPEIIAHYGKTIEERMAINNYIRDCLKLFFDQSQNLPIEQIEEELK